MSMDHKKQVLLEELNKVAKILGKTRFSRGELFKHSTVPITQRDIENEFGSFRNAMIAAKLKPRKSHIITNEELFVEYNEVYRKLRVYPVGHNGLKQLSELTPFSGSTYKKRFGGLKNFIFEFKNWQLDNKANGSDDISVIETTTHKITDIEPVKLAIGSFDNKGRFTGKASENLVVSELLFRGFNAQILQVDEGIDVFAVNVKNNELYLIQVKHTYYDQFSKSRSISITVSTFEKNKKSNVYYIFVLEREINKRDYLILPFHKIDELLKNGAINREADSKSFSFCLFHKTKEDAYVGKISEVTEVTRFLNAWDVLL